jgi:hypothetical protein
MRYLGGHLGITVSALVDGQLDPPSAERAWAHVHGCALCRRQVEREGWVKTQLAAMTGEQGPPPQLLGALYGLGSAQSAPDEPPAEEALAWAAVDEIERQGRGARRAGIALVGVGSVSAAVIGLATLTGSTLGIGRAPTTAPTQTPTAQIAPVAEVQGRLPLERLLRSGQGQEASGPRRGEGPADLRR